MAIFSKKQKNTKKEESSEKKDVVKSVPQFKGEATVDFSTLIRPRITEKASDVSAQNVYVFNVSPRATKLSIKRAVVNQYKVTPTKIGIVTVPRKRKVIRGRRGLTGGGKKAYIYLKKGDVIEIA